MSVEGLESRGLEGELGVRGLWGPAVLMSVPLLPAVPAGPGKALWGSMDGHGVQYVLRPTVWHPLGSFCFAALAHLSNSGSSHGFLQCRGLHLTYELLNRRLEVINITPNDTRLCV